MACTFLALLLLILENFKSILKMIRQPDMYKDLDEEAISMLGELYERAGLVKPQRKDARGKVEEVMRELQPEIFEPGYDEIDIDYEDLTEEQIEDLATSIDPGDPGDIVKESGLPPDLKLELCLYPLTEESATKAIAVLLSPKDKPIIPEERIRPAPNILAVAHEMLIPWLTDKERYIDQILEFLEKGITSGDATEIYRKMVSEVSQRTADKMYWGIVVSARDCFTAFGIDTTVSNTLYFGCEPYCRSVERHKPDDRVLVDFTEAVGDTETKKNNVYIFQPDLKGDEALVAKALKASWFEAILYNQKRINDGSKMPLAAYIADEFHRFITSDKVHGEQSFLDTCRSFGAFCVLACQSMSSMKHALAENSNDSKKNEAALQVLLTNTANKLFFRSTDSPLHDYVSKLCPDIPGFPKVTVVRPLSTLKAGECYASLTDGRFERRQLHEFS